jgi:hypothetical protein
METHESILEFLPANFDNSAEAILSIQGSRNNNLAVGF